MKDKIKVCLWMDGKAREAAEFYCSIFPQSRIVSENAIIVEFHLNGNEFLALNGGPRFTFNEAISLVVSCDTQEEIDHYWYKLSEGGEESMCGWLKDKYGVSWQVVPSVLGSLMNDPEKGQRVIDRFLKMKKFVLAELLEA